MKLLIVVDMQNDFVSGSLGTKEAQVIVPDVVEKINKYYKMQPGEGAVVYTKDMHGANYLNTEEGKNLPILHCISGTEGSELIDDIKKLAKNPCIFTKDTFGSADLFEFLDKNSREFGIESIELCGVCTDICVIANTIIAKTACPNVPIYIDPTCCAGTTPRGHQKAIKLMRDSLQIHMIGE